MYLKKSKSLLTSAMPQKPVAKRSKTNHNILGLWNQHHDTPESLQLTPGKLPPWSHALSPKSTPSNVKDSEDDDDVASFLRDLDNLKLNFVTSRKRGTSQMMMMMMTRVEKSYWSCMMKIWLKDWWICCMKITPLIWTGCPPRLKQELKGESKQLSMSTKSY